MLLFLGHLADEGKVSVSRGESSAVLRIILQLIANLRARLSRI